MEIEKNKEIVSSASYAINGMLILIVVYLHLLSGFGYYDRFLLRIPVEMFGFFMTWFYFKSGGGIMQTEVFGNQCERNFIEV